ncbi:MBL fold metallo-hydrolase, partial [bacterium]|nr:MBL fold metallo-hydrolase [bacterium]
MRFEKVLSGLIVLLFVLSAVSAQTLKIVHFDIGQGDATLIISPTGETMLVDAGYQNEVYPLQNWLQANGITDFNYTVATHYHADHIGGFLTLFPSYLPDIAYDRGDNPGYTTATYYNYISAASSVRQTLNAGDQIDLGGGVNVTAVCVNGHLMSGASYTLNDENERSICLLVEYNNFRYVVAGDLGGGAGGLYDLETPCSQLIGDINVFEVNHHGSYSSTNANWLATLDAEAAVASLEDNNS